MQYLWLPYFLILWYICHVYLKPWVDISDKGQVRYKFLSPPFPISYPLSSCLSTYFATMRAHITFAKCIALLHLYFKVPEDTIIRFRVTFEKYQINFMVKDSIQVIYIELGYLYVRISCVLIIINKKFSYYEYVI